MHLVTYMHGEVETTGILDRAAEAVFDLAELVADAPASINELIEQGPVMLEGLATALAGSGGGRALSEVRLLAPIPAPKRNIICVGRNYRDHANEFSASGFDATQAADPVPDHPVVFTKATTSVTGPATAIRLDFDPSGTTDYEGELGVVIGTGGRGIKREAAMSAVFGYTIINDVTARDLQKKHRQWWIGKSPDTFCPMGPAIVTTGAIPNPGDLRLETRVNGELRQDAPVSDLIFDIPAIIETVSENMTLLPGDIIATGTAKGVGIGFEPPVYLTHGDEVAITIEPIGTLVNRARRGP